MTNSPRNPRTPAIIVAVIALVIAACTTAFAVGTVAGAEKAASKITVCVKKKGGALYKAKNCGANKKLSWNVKGPAGPAGKDGAVAGYSVAQSGSLTINNNHHVKNTVLSLNLPAGNFIVNSTAMVNGSDDTNDSYANVECELGDGTTTNKSRWLERLQQVFILYTATTTLPNTLAVSSPNPFTVTLKCSDEHDSGQDNFTESVSNARITAVETSGNS